MTPDFDPSFRLDAPSDDRAVRQVRTKIAAWIACDAFYDLLALYGGKIDDSKDLDETLALLERFSDRWDFRRMAAERGAQADDGSRGAGAARWLSATTELGPEADERILRDASELGLVRFQPPPLSHYDCIAALGGARLSCKLRTELAADVLASMPSARYVALLGASRPIPESERDATNSYAPGAENEFDLMCAAGAQVFGATWSRETRSEQGADANLRWMVKESFVEYGDRAIRVAAVSAPSLDPGRRRANSADTINFLLTHPGLEAPRSLLLITSQIYVPYVQLEALRTVALTRGVVVHTVGVEANRLPPLQGLAAPNHYLQEVRSAIQAANRFCHCFPIG